MRIYGIVALIALAAAGQQQPPRQQPAAGAPTVRFSTTANLVIVDVTVKDKSGNTIDSLGEHDFTVLEDGKAQKIAVFEHQRLSLEPEAPEPPPSLDSQHELPEEPKTTITNEGPNKVQYHDKRLLVLYFDFTTMGIPEQLRAQEAAQTFLDKQMTASDLVAVMLNTSGSPAVKTDFTDKRSMLKDIIAGLPIGDMSDLADDATTGDDTSEEDTGAAYVADETEFNIFNSNQKLSAIEDTVRKLATLPEKKVLIYISGGIPKSGIDNQAQLEASINAAVKSNVQIWPLDARGLMADPPGGTASRGATRANVLLSAYNAQRSRINDTQETLSTLASETGGKVFLDNNDLSVGIVQAQREFRSYYILGYYTTNTKEDGKYRKITVKLANNQSARLEFRDGYYADKVWNKQNGSDKEHQLIEALTSGDPPTDIPLAIEADYFRVSPTAYFVPVSVKMPGSVIALADKKSGGETEFDFIGNVLDERKSVVGQVRDFIHIRLDPAEKERLATRNFHYDAGFTLGPGNYRLRFLVRENQTGKIGVFDARFTVPDLAADSTLLKTSSVIWSSQKEPLKSAVGTAERFSRKVVASNPLILGDEKVVPNITRVFRRSQKMYVAFDVYDAAPDPADGRTRRVAVSMSLFNQKGVKAFETSPVTATQLAATRPNAVPVQLQFPLKGLAPGRYVCQINVVDEVGRKFAFPRANLVVQ